MSGIILCDDILGTVGEQVKLIRDEDTRKYHIDIWESSESYRGWWCLSISPAFPNTNAIPQPTIREKTLNAVEQIGTDFIISDDDGERLHLKHKLEVVNDFSNTVNSIWIDYNHYKIHDYLQNYTGDPPKARVTVDDGEILFVY